MGCFYLITTQRNILTLKCGSVPLTIVRRNAGNDSEDQKMQCGYAIPCHVMPNISVKDSYLEDGEVGYRQSYVSFASGSKYKILAGNIRERQCTTGERICLEIFNGRITCRGEKVC
jgi:hypothetical protein